MNRNKKDLENHGMKNNLGSWAVNINCIKICNGKFKKHIFFYSQIITKKSLIIVVQIIFHHYDMLTIMDLFYHIFQVIISFQD